MDQLKDKINNTARISNFRICCGLLLILLVTSMSRDITRPFYGLHSWGESHAYWNARAHINYGLGYTKGFLTKAVGDPPIENPKRYLNHPQLPTLLNVPFVALFGFHEWSLRAVYIFQTALTLLLFIRLIRLLTDDKTALLVGTIFCLFPLTNYFGTIGWLYPLALWSILCYLTIIGSIPEHQPTGATKYYFAFCLFAVIQMGWEGFFFDAAIGVHYVFHCIHRYIRQKERPDFVILAILILAPALSMMTNFTVMAAGYNWDWERIYITFKWRATTGEVQTHNWGLWFEKLWEYAATNFTKPVLFISIAYLTIGRLILVQPDLVGNSDTIKRRRFPQFWLFLMIPFFQLFLLKGCLWRHQTWERPMIFIVSISTALGIMVIYDLLKNRFRRLALAIPAILVGCIVFYSIAGTNYYYGIRWQHPNKIEMLKTLNEKIPADKWLLSYESFVVNQGGKAKIPFYRPEYAWYLDREVTQARTFKDIEISAKTGRYPYYLIPRDPRLSNLIAQMERSYKVAGVFYGGPGEQKNGKFYRTGMLTYLLFDLKN